MNDRTGELGLVPSQLCSAEVSIELPYNERENPEKKEDEIFGYFAVYNEPHQCIQNKSF